MLDESDLERVQPIAGRNSLDGCDVARTDIDGQRHAGERGNFIYPDGAGRTRTSVADHLCAGEAKRVSEGLSERNARLDGERVSNPIHMEHDRERHRALGVGGRGGSRWVL